MCHWILLKKVDDQLITWQPIVEVVISNKDFHHKLKILMLSISTGLEARDDEYSRAFPGKSGMKTMQ